MTTHPPDEALLAAYATWSYRLAHLAMDVKRFEKAIHDFQFYGEAADGFDYGQRFRRAKATLGDALATTLASMEAGEDRWGCIRNRLKGHHYPIAGSESSYDWRAEEGTLGLRFFQRSFQEGIVGKEESVALYKCLIYFAEVLS